MVTNTDAQSGTLTNGYTYRNPAPTVTSITPNTGTTAGGTSVTIAGTGFVAGATVSLGGTAATAVNVVSSTSITATTPAHAAGAANVVVTNSDAQAGTLTNGYTYTTSTGGGPITFVQVKSATPQTASASVAVTYPIAQTLGNLNIVAVGWNDTTSTVSGITDTRGNTYVLAIGPTTGTGLRQSIYYAKNIVAGSNTVTVTFSKAAAFVDVRVLEYSGLDTANPLDQDGRGSGQRDDCEQRRGHDHRSKRIDLRRGNDYCKIYGRGKRIHLANHHQPGCGHRGRPHGGRDWKLQCHRTQQHIQLGHAGSYFQSQALISDPWGMGLLSRPSRARRLANILYESSAETVDHWDA